MNDKTKEILELIGSIGLLIAGGVYLLTSGDRRDVKIAEIEGTYPPEYWLAKKAEADKEIKQHEINIQYKERLELDKRNRADAERRERAEFEKNAPEEYWKQKQIEAEEAARVEIEREKASVAKAQMRANVDIARKRSQAMESSARSLGNALRY